MILDFTNFRNIDNVSSYQRSIQNEIGVMHCPRMPICQEVHSPIGNSALEGEFSKLCIVALWGAVFQKMPSESEFCSLLYF